MIEVELPDGTIAEFPDGTSREAMQRALSSYRTKSMPEADMSFTGRLKDNFIGTDDGVESWGEKLGTGIRGAGAAVARGIADIPALPVNLAQLATKGVEKATGMEGPSRASRALDSLPDTRDMLGAIPVIGEESKFRAPGVAGDFISTAGEFAGGAGLMSGPKAMLKYGVAPGVASEGAGQVTEGTAIEPYARAGAAIGTGLASSAATNARAASNARSEYVKNAPTADHLRDQAKTLYQKASSRGVVASPGAMKMLKAQMDNLAKKSGFVTPKGNVVKTGENVRPFLKSLDDYTDGPISVDDLQSLRAQIQLVAESAVPKVSRLGVQMLKAHDKFTDRLAPELKTANALYTRAMRGDMMDKVDDLADIKASQFTQSGRENALRSEYRALDRDITKGKVKGLRPDQVQAVSDVSRGTRGSNLARSIGKAAPTGVVSAAGGGGIAFGIGNAIGGPAMGGLAAAGTMGTGMLGRTVATSLQEQAAQFASAAMRSGVPMEEVARQLGGGPIAAAAIAAARSQQGSAE